MRSGILNCCTTFTSREKVRYCYLLIYFEKNSSYVSGVSICIFVASYLCIFVALYVRMFVARASKVEGTIS